MMSYVVEELEAASWYGSRTSFLSRALGMASADGGIIGGSDQISLLPKCHATINHLQREHAPSRATAVS